MAVAHRTTTKVNGTPMDITVANDGKGRVTIEMDEGTAAILMDLVADGIEAETKMLQVDLSPQAVLDHQSVLTRLQALEGADTEAHNATYRVAV